MSQEGILVGMKKFVILGGGYGGLTIASNLLEKDLPDDTVLVIIDRSPFQGLKPNIMH